MAKIDTYEFFRKLSGLKLEKHRKYNKQFEMTSGY